MATASTISRYGSKWPNHMDALQIEFGCIRLLSNKKYPPSELKPDSLFQHYRNAMSLLWPKDDHHRWSDLILREYCDNEILVILGCSDSSKTWTISKIILVDYWAFPDETLWLVSTTEGRGAELRIWGCIKDLFNKARERFDWLAGNPIDYLKCITSDSISEDSARSLRRGCVIVPCKTGGTISGLAPYIGIKSPRLRHAGDEVAAMSDAFLNAYANWYGKENFKGIMSGNFMEVDDPLGVASEPEGGWDSFVDSGKTQKWKSRFYGAMAIALDGRDSPNFDFPLDQFGRNKYPYLIGKKKLEGVSKAKGEDSWEWFSQCVGKPVKGMDIWRVISKDFCIQNRASEEVVWDSDAITKIYSLDPAYGGGDRCVGREIKFGKEANGGDVLDVGTPETIPIKINTGIDPEDQIAAFVKNRLSQLDIPPENCFYDSFGRGTLGFAFSKVFAGKCPVPVDSGAQATNRPVRYDLFIKDEVTKNQRLKRCDEHYKKFVTEMWFSVREVIDSQQMRGLDAETIREGCMRKFSLNNQNKREVEPKEDMKERLGKSPDYFDNLAIGVEGARQKGFKIQKLGVALTPEDKPDWMQEDYEEYRETIKGKLLTHA